MLACLLIAALPISFDPSAGPPPQAGPAYLMINVEGTVPAAEVENFKAGLAQTIARFSRGKFTPSIDLVDISLSLPTGEGEPLLVTTRREAFEAARTIGPEPADYDRVAVLAPRAYFNPGGGCVGTVDHHVVFCEQWEDGPPGPGGLPTPVLLMHELGHSYGWRHSTFWDPTSTVNTLGEGEEENRGDLYDIMGGRWPGIWTEARFHYFNPWYMLRMGWLEPEEVREFDETTINPTVLLRPLQSPPPPPGTDVYPSAIRIRREGQTSFPSGPQVDDYWTDYWIFWRQYEGEENSGMPGAAACAEGPVIHLGYRTNIGRSILLDLDPAEDWTGAPTEDAPFAVGQTFSDSGLDVTFDGIVNGLAQVTIALPTGYAAPPRPPKIVFDTSTFPAPAGSASGDSWTLAVNASDPEGGAIDRVEFWLFPNDDEFLGHMAKGRLENGALPYPEIFPRVHDDVPAVLYGPPPLFVSISEPSEITVNGTRHEWTTELKSGDTFFPDGIYFLVARAVTVGPEPRANVAWRPFVVDQGAP